MEGSEPFMEPVASRIHVVPGDSPEIETLVFDGQVILTVSPPDGYCPVDAAPATKHMLRLQYGLVGAPEEPALGLAVQRSWYEDIESYTNTGRHPVFLSVRLGYPAGGPTLFDIDRAAFITMLSSSISGVSDLEIAFDGEDEVLTVVERWLAQARSPAEATVDNTRIAGKFASDPNGFYVATVMAADVGERRVFRAVVSGYTIIKGLSLSTHSFAEIEKAEELRELLNAAKLYTRHLIEVNENVA